MLNFTEYDTRLAAYAVVLDDQDRILLALWNEVDPPEWTMPGGGVEFDETPAEGCVREVQEETGYGVELTRLLDVMTFAVPAGGLRVGTNARPFKGVQVLYEARVVGGELRHEVDGTTAEARWVPIAEVRGLPHVETVDRVLDLIGR